MRCSVEDRVASWLVPVALLIAVMAYVFSGNIVTAVTVLVVFCPCALVLATPTAIMAAIGQATKHGIIIKSGESLEKMGKADTIAFDKTGTLTKGNFKVTNITAFIGSKETLLQNAAKVEAFSHHPIAASIKQAYDRKIDLKDISDITGLSIKELQEELTNVNDDLNEMFDAQLQTIGIPADVPIGVEVGIEPHILETVSRLAGIFVIVGASDTITSNGIFSTTYKLFRIRGFNDKVQSLTPDITNDVDTVKTQNIPQQAQNDNTSYQRPTGDEVESTINWNLISGIR